MSPVISSTETPVAFSPDKNLDWYVNAGGGYAKNGDPKRAHVTQPDEKWQTLERLAIPSDNLLRPRARAAILVPEQAQEPRSNLPAVLRVVGSVPASLTTVIVLTTR